MAHGLELGGCQGGKKHKNRLHVKKKVQKPQTLTSKVERKRPGGGEKSSDPPCGDAPHYIPATDFFNKKEGELARGTGVVVSFGQLKKKRCQATPAKTANDAYYQPRELQREGETANEKKKNRGEAEKKSTGREVRCRMPRQGVLG